MKFTKMQGIGNDYVYLECLKEPPPEDPAGLAVKISRQHYGVGADGLILILPPEAEGDCRMRMFNSDGSEAQMCGNGLRCVARYVYDHGHVRKANMLVETGAGLRECEILEGKDVRVHMGEPNLLPSALPALLPDADAPVLRHTLALAGEEYAFTLVSMGNPHAVCVVQDVDAVDIERLGPLAETNPLFPERVNVEFVEVLDRTHIRMRVWERGSGVTLACGTGACASLVATALLGLTEKRAELRLDGGFLEIAWDEDITMRGPAVEVFTGDWQEN